MGPITALVLATIRQQSEQGRLLPLVGDHFFWQMLGGYDGLLQGWARQLGYSGPRIERARMAQYARIQNGDAAAVKEDYLETMKSYLLESTKARDTADRSVLAELEATRDRLTVTELARAVRLEALAGEAFDAIRVLAQMALPIYITTTYHGFLEQALLEEGKKPRSLICRWRDDLPDDLTAGSGTTPDYTPYEPLVFHLFGLDSAPESMVFSEEDHLDFLTRLALERDIVPPVVRQALALSSPLLLGYHFREWEFRVVFRGLMLGRSRRGQQAGAATQLAPEATEEFDPEQARNFIESYLDSGSLSVFWGTEREFLSELRQRQRK